MTPARRRLLPAAAVVAAQLLCVWAAVGLLGVRTEHDIPFPGGVSHASGEYRILRGYPTPWREDRQRWRWEWDWPDTLRSPAEYVGSNPAVPLAVVALALCLPPVAAAACRRNPLTRPTRCLSVALFASTAAIAAAPLEAQTAASWFGDPPLMAHPPGEWVARTQTYERVQEYGWDARKWLGMPPSDRFSREEWLARTRLTLLAFATGAAAGCVLLKPWRRAESERAPANFGGSPPPSNAPGTQPVP